MKTFTIISKPGCSFCDKAKVLLRTKGFEYNETILDVGQQLAENINYMSPDELQQLVPGAKTVPQIFKGDTLIGGYTELVKYLNSTT
jgi:glutaredoxin